MLCFMNAMLKGKFETLNACIRLEKRLKKVVYLKKLGKPKGKEKKVNKKN